MVAGGSYAFPDLGEDPTGAGDRPAWQGVEVSVDDPGFADPVEAVLDAESTTWRVDMGELAPGKHVIYARARRDNATSDAVSKSFTVAPDQQVQWQVTPAAGTADDGAWSNAAGVRDWTFAFSTTDYGAGQHAILVRLTHRGSEIAGDAVAVGFG